MVKPANIAIISKMCRSIPPLGSNFCYNFAV